jgi:DNA invertase Pin-like site-specific DNA recombinase
MVGFKESELKVERVAAYVRVSTQEQKLHGLSLDAQRMKLTQYAEEHNMRIVGWYVDEGVSGRKLIRRRPELQRMIQDAEAGKFDRIIFIKLDRFFRSVAEYHECMKRIAPVIWTTTEEDYDLSTANGRMLVNMKLTIAEMEADQTGERIKIVNEYKVQTGQPLVGDQSQPFGFKNAVNPTNGRKMVIRDPDEEEIVYDLINNFLTHQSKRRTMIYVHAKYHISIPYNSIKKLLSNTMLYGFYRGNPNYCEAYIDKETFDKIQDILSRNVKCNTENRAYIFSGLIKCPGCGKPLKGSMSHMRRGEKEYRYKKYRCGNHRMATTCEWNKVVSENTLQRLMLKHIEQYLENAKVQSVEITDSSDPKIPKMDVEEIHAEIDRLNYSWRTGKIRTVEQYESQYEEMMDRLAQAEAEQSQPETKDFSKIEAILHDGWKAIYENLDDSYKRAFWRSFVKVIEIDWEGEEKKITNIIFF